MIRAAFHAGVLDIPLRPTGEGQAGYTCQGNEGPLSGFGSRQSSLQRSSCGTFHKDKMKERADYEKRSISFDGESTDIYAIGKGRLVGPA